MAINILIDDVTDKIDKTTKFIIFPYFQLGCGYINLKTLLDKFPDRFKEIGVFNLPIFSVPFLNNNEIFFNSTIAHEIGHFIVDNTEVLQVEESNITQNILENPKIKEKIIIKMQKIMDENSDLDKNLECLRLKGVVTKKYFEKIKQWIKEILSDLIGIKIFGLPFLFGFIKTINHSEAEYGSSQHPPPWLRFNYLYKEYENNFMKKIKNFEFENNKNNAKMNFGNMIQEDLKILKDYFNKVKNGHPPIVYEIELELIEKSVNFKKLISDILKKNSNLELLSYDYDRKNKTEIMKLLKKLLNYITPNEIIDIKKEKTYPAAYRNILNAGWFFYLYLINNHYELLNFKEHNLSNRPEVNQRLNNLILKAIELSNIHKISKSKLEKIIKT
ncbi:MAG: hypothetical protein ACFFG0_43675 [Candidatus Thorarchaeota archaeon]